MKVLLLNCPYKELIIRDNYCCFTSKTGYIWPPVDFLYLSALFRNKAILKVIDAIVENFSWEKVYKEIDIFNPDIIIALTGTVSFLEDLKMLKKVKNKKIYLMGNFPCFQPLYILKKYNFIQGIIHNFFDNTIPDFLLGKLNYCFSISYKEKNGFFKLGKVNFLKPYTKIILGNSPQYNLFSLDKYSTPFIHKKPMVTIMTSFGCPFNCKFCVASVLAYYPRDIKDLEKEFDEIKRNKIREIFFEDSTFNANSSFLREICNLLIDKNYQFSWSANVHSFNLTKEMLIFMKKAGCHTIQVGIESGNQETLNLYAPSKRINRISQTVNFAKEVGIKVLGYFIIGFPNENIAMTKNTIKYALNLNPNFVSFSVLTPDYGTELYNEAIKKKLIKKKILTFDSSSKAILNNPELDQKKQNQLITEAYIKFYFRPSKLIIFFTDLKNIFRYIKNGFYLIKKIIGKLL